MISRLIRGALLALAGMLLLSATARAAGLHEGLDCLGCHDPHYAKAMKLLKVNNPKHPNPRTGTNIDGVSALCLGCHNLAETGGAGVRPVYLHMTHPVNVKPNSKIAKMPESLARDGMIQCVSCHDPHPSNPSWRYLRVDTEDGASVGKFCMACHPAKTDAAFYKTDAKSLKIFSSMNEEAGAKHFDQNDPALTISNQTPDYIRPLGDFPNELGPAYLTVPTMDWYYAPDKSKLPPELRPFFTDAKPAAAATPASASTPATSPAAPPKAK